MTQPQEQRSSRLLRSRLALAAAALLFASGATPVLAGPTTDNTAARTTQDTGHAIVQLIADPLAADARTRPAKGKKIDFSSATVKSQRALLSKQRNDYKAWLRANVPQAAVTGEFDISLNAVAVKLNGATLAQVSGSPLVRSAQYQGLFYKNVVGSGPRVDQRRTGLGRQGGSARRWQRREGRDRRLGHRPEPPLLLGCRLSGADPTGRQEVHQQQGDRSARLQQPAQPERLRRKGGRLARHARGWHGRLQLPDAGHGQRRDDSVQAISGVAPRALLGNYNVFPGTIESARSEDILNALEAAYADGFDVANMSLGGGSHGVQDLLTVAVDNLDQANMVVAISNGNEGPGYFTVGSPGMAARGLSAGASTVPHFVGAPVTVDGNTYGAASGDFAVVQSDTTAPLAVVAGTTNGLDTACGALTAGSLTGKIALISRGGCTFSAKIRNAQAAGAAVVLVANNVAGDPTAMGTDGAATQPTIPAYMVSLGDGSGTQVDECGLHNSGRSTFVLLDDQRQHHGRLQQPGSDRR